MADPKKSDRVADPQPEDLSVPDEWMGPAVPCTSVTFPRAFVVYGTAGTQNTIREGTDQFGHPKYRIDWLPKLDSFRIYFRGGFDESLVKNGQSPEHLITSGGTQYALKRSIEWIRARVEWVRNRLEWEDRERKRKLAAEEDAA
jgi:hypothetical protein